MANAPDETIREYLKRRGYADHVVRGGLSRLVSCWESNAREIAKGTPQDYYEYINDMDGRRILQEVLDLTPPEEANLIRERVARADASVRSRLIPTPHCIWGERVASDNGYTRDRHWWYFHRPSQTDDNWLPESLS